MTVDLAANGDAEQGGSTITQQVVKNLVLRDSTKALERKLHEMILSVGVSETYTKDQILEMYLNTIDYGDQNQGIEAAARNYFGLKPSKEIVNGRASSRFQRTLYAHTCQQVALLVGLAQRPDVTTCRRSTHDKTYLPAMTQCDDSLWDNPCVGDPRAGPCIPSATYDWGTKMAMSWLDWRRARDGAPEHGRP